MSDRTRDRFSFSAEDLERPEDATDAVLVARTLSGTYRSNWSTLKHASQSAALACAVTMDNHLLPTAQRVVEKNAHPAERAFLLALNHNNLVGGPALGAVVLTAFAQESFVRIGYQLTEELRLRRNRSRRAVNLDAAIVKSITAFEALSFPNRCYLLLKVLGVPQSRDKVQPAIDLMLFRNTIAHDSPQLHLKDGQRVSVDRGSQIKRQERIGSFVTLESESCPVRLKHVKAAIDAHDQLVSLCVVRSVNHDWTEAINDFESGIGLRIRDAFKGGGWYDTLKNSASKWEKQFQTQTEASLESFIEMRNAIVQRSRMRDSI